MREADFSTSENLIFKSVTFPYRNFYK